MITVPYNHAGKPCPELVWLDKQTQLQLIDLERKYSDIAWLPLDIPNIVPDDLEKFIQYFNNNAVDGVRKHASYDEPDLNPNNKFSSWNNPYWKTLEIYRSKSAKEWFGTDTIENHTVDATALFPELYTKIFDLLPYKEIFFIRFWSNTRAVGLHRDQDWTYNIPLSCRAIIHDTNTVPTFYVVKTKGLTEDRHYVDLPADTNSFAFNNGAFWHGADFVGKNKILMVVSGIPDVDKLKQLLENSVAKYKPPRVFNNKDRYIVYNITSRSVPLPSPHSENDIKDLYTLLLTAPEVTAVEEHQSADQLRSELRVIFWNQSAYSAFSDRTKERYQSIINRFNKNYTNQPVEFFRYTSADNYQSEFPEKTYPDATPLINWSLIPYFKQWFIDNIMPLGKVQEYIGNGQFNSTNITGCRFLKERTNSVRRLMPSKTSMENFPRLLAYHFDHVLQYAMHQPYIYHRFTKLCDSIEKMAEEYIDDCEHSAVLIGHESLGKEITLHTHRLSDQKKLTVTFIVRVTFDDHPVKYKFYEPIADKDPNLKSYYTTPLLLKQYVLGKEVKEIVSGARSSMLVFDAGHVPHSVSYSNDLYIYFVYDNVTFQPGMLEKIKEQSHHSAFGQLYFFDF